MRAYRFDSARTRFVHVPEGDIVLEGSVRRIQGGVFSENGHVLLSSDHSNDIRCYSILNGRFLGRSTIQKNRVLFEEVEGLTIRKGFSTGGVSTDVHVLLLDNDAADRDDIFFKHYRVPLSSHL